MSSGRARSPCDTDPRELRLDVICPGTLAAARDGTTARAATDGSITRQTSTRVANSAEQHS
jgi:hypothetical protein